MKILETLLNFDIALLKAYENTSLEIGVDSNTFQQILDEVSGQNYFERVNSPIQQVDSNLLLVFGTIYIRNLRNR